MKLGFMTIAKVYRKKDVQEITDRATGRVTGEYYPVILDDGEDTLDATVPKDVYNGIEEDKIYPSLPFTLTLLHPFSSDTTSTFVFIAN